MFLFMADDTQTPRDANAPGSGKTVLIAGLVEQIRQRGERRVLYDWIPARRSGQAGRRLVLNGVWVLRGCIVLRPEGSIDER